MKIYFSKYSFIAVDSLQSGKRKNQTIVCDLLWKQLVTFNRPDLTCMYKRSIILIRLRLHHHLFLSLCARSKRVGEHAC